MSQTQSNCVVHMDINTIELCDVDRHTIELRYERNHSNFFGYRRNTRFGKIVKEMFLNKDYLDWDAPKLQKMLQQENWMG